MKKILKLLKNSKVLFVLVTLITLILTFGLVMLFVTKSGRVLIDNSQVSAPVINLSPTSPSKLSYLSVGEGSNVKKGDVLAQTETQSIRAYTDGLIVQVNNQPGTIVGPQTPVVSMIDPSGLRVAAAIDENKGLKDIKTGQAVSFTVDALPGKTFWGYVDEVAPTAKQTQIAFSISSERPVQQFVIYAKFDISAHPEIRNGMSAKMTVFIRTKS